MILRSHSPLSKVSRALAETGVVSIPGFRPELSTYETAGTFGKLVEIHQLLPGAHIPTIQQLKPRTSHEVGDNQYSRHFGLGAFPLHTDLAHWAVPPRYILLRCIVGCTDVSTRLMRCARVEERISGALLRRSVFANRRKPGSLRTFVRALVDLAGIACFRWDPIFIEPVNQAARDVAKIMRENSWDDSIEECGLSAPGDILIIDNWQTLHGRSAIGERAKNRLIERAYLSEIFT